MKKANKKINNGWRFKIISSWYNIILFNYYTYDNFIIA